MASITRFVNAAADAGGNGTTDALTGANCAYQLPSSAVNDIQTNGDGASINYVYIADGDYEAAGYMMSLDHANHANLRIIGESRSGTRIRSTNNHTVIFQTDCGTDIKIETLTLINPLDKRAWYYGPTNPLTIEFNDVDFVSDENTTTGSLFQTGTAFTKITINRCRCIFVDNVMSIGAQAGTFDINCCISEASDYVRTDTDSTGKLTHNGTGILTINNSVLLDAGGITVNQVNAAGTTNVVNSTVQGCLQNSTAYPIYKTAGTLNVYNTLTVGNPQDGDGKNIYQANVDSANLLGYQPGIIKPKKGGYIVVCKDDYGVYADYVAPLAAKLAAYGWPMTWFVNVGGADIDVVKSGLAAGIEIAAHSHSHTRLDYTHAMTIAYGGVGANPIWTNDGSTITLNCDLDVDKLEIDITVGNDDTLGAILLHSGTSNWTLAKSTNDGQDIEYLKDALKSSSLEIAAAQAVPDDIDIDETAFYADEITGSKATLDAELGALTDPQTNALYVCNSFAAPYSIMTANGKTQLIADGYLTARNYISSNKPQLLVDIDMYQQVVLSSSNIDVSTEAKTRQCARAIGFCAAQTGAVIFVLSHNATEIPLASWDYILDEWSKIANLTITSSQLMAKAIQESGLWDDDGDGTWSRNTTFGDGDYRLRPDSDCRDAGKPVAGLTTDFEGKPVPMGSAPDIGAYEFPVPSPMGLTPGLGMGGRMMPPRRRRR